VDSSGVLSEVADNRGWPTFRGSDLLKSIYKKIKIKNGKFWGFEIIKKEYNKIFYFIFIKLIKFY